MHRQIDMAMNTAIRMGHLLQQQMKTKVIKHCLWHMANAVPTAKVASGSIDNQCTNHCLCTLKKLRK